MRVLNYEAHNVMRLSDVSFDLSGRHLFLVGGKNAQGKSSALTALLMALCGKSGMDNYPDVALKEGEDKGWVKVQLSGEDEELHEPTGLTVELFLRRKRSGQIVEEFRILDSAGEEAPEPRTLLKRLYEVRAFDPLAFERLDKKQKQELLKKLLALDFTAETEEYEQVYAERAGVNRDGVKLKAQFELMKKYDDAPAEEVQTSVLLEELEKRRSANQLNEKIRKASELARNELAQRLKIEENALAALDKAQKEYENAKTVREHAAVEVVAAENACKGLVDEQVDVIREQIKGADANNAKFRANAKWKEAHGNLAELRKKSEALGERLQEINEAKAKKLQEAKWPVPGLALDEAGVLLDGLPFEQASKSQRVIASTKIGMALNPKLRLLVSENGGDLDTETLDALETLLAENDFQMLVELVTRSNEDEDLCAVLIHDGKQKPAKEKKDQKELLDAAAV